MPPTKPVAAYYRVSKARDDMTSPELYEREIERYCTYKEVELGETFSDIDFSGYTGSKTRPALEELKARRNEFSAVVIPKLARFGRSMRDLIELFALFDGDGISLIFLDMNIDTSTSQGRLLRHVMAAFAEYESDVKSDYARMNHEHAVARGKPWGGHPPYGYRRQDKDFVVLEHEAKVVREIFRMWNEGMKVTRIAAELNAAGYRRRDGGPWKYSYVGVRLDDVVCTGLRRFQGQLVEAGWEVIIDRDTWVQARERRTRSIELERIRKAPRPDRSYLLSGLIFCGFCGKRLCRSGRSTRTGSSYACPDALYSLDLTPCPGGRVTDTRVERFIVDALKDRYSDPSAGGARYEEFTRLWGSSSVDQRRHIITSTIARIELIAHPADKPSEGPGSHPRRKISITWRDQIPGATLARAIEPVVQSSITCSKCGKRKDRREFYAAKTKTYGREMQCKECRAKMQHRRRHPSQTWAEYQRELRAKRWVEEERLSPAERLRSREEVRSTLEISRGGAQHP